MFCKLSEGVLKGSESVLIFKDEEVLDTLRKKANQDFTSDLLASLTQLQVTNFSFLTAEEEIFIVKYYETCLKRFLLEFMPRREILPRPVKALAYHFYKRFFLVSSVMDYHPREIMLTCVFLACKVGEYDVYLDDFVSHVQEYKENVKLLKQIILDQELELLPRCNFQLNIHTPYTPLEHFIPELEKLEMFQPRAMLRDMMKDIHMFLNSAWLTDVCLLFHPELIALAAVMNAVAKRCQQIYLTVFYHIVGRPSPILDTTMEKVRKIRRMVKKNVLPSDLDRVQQLEMKLNKCRNPLNDPCSNMFKRKTSDILKSFDE